MPIDQFGEYESIGFSPTGAPTAPGMSEEESGFFGEMGKGLVRGFLNVGSGLVGTAEWIVPGQQESWIKAKENIQSASSRFPFEDNSWEGWAGRVIGEAFPYMGTALVAGYAGAGIAGGIAGAGTAGLTGQAAALGGGLAAKAPMVGALIGSATVGFAVEGQQAYDNAITHGSSENEANAERLIVGTINAAIEATQIGRLMKFHKTGALSLREFIRNVRNKAWDLIGGDAKKFTGQVLRTALEEGLEESLQEGVSISIPGFIRGDYPKNEDGTIAWGAVLQRIGEAGLGGGFAGGVLGGAGALVGAAPEIGRPSNSELDVAINKIQKLKGSQKEKDQFIFRLEELKTKDRPVENQLQQAGLVSSDELFQSRVAVVNNFGQEIFQKAEETGISPEYILGNIQWHTVGDKTISRFPQKVTDQKSLEEVGNAIAKQLGLGDWKIEWKPIEKETGNLGFALVTGDKTATINVRTVLGKKYPPITKPLAAHVGVQLRRKGEAHRYTQAELKRVIVHELGHLVQRPLIPTKISELPSDYFFEQNPTKTEWWVRPGNRMGLIGRGTTKEKAKQNALYFINSGRKRNVHHPEYVKWVEDKVKELFAVRQGKVTPVSEAGFPQTLPLSVSDIDKAINKVKSYKMPVKEQEQWISRLEGMKRKLADEVPTTFPETLYIPKEQENVYRGKDTGKVYYEPTGKDVVQTTRMEEVPVEPTELKPYEIQEWAKQFGMDINFNKNMEWDYSHRAKAGTEEIFIGTKGLSGNDIKLITLHEVGHNISDDEGTFHPEIEDEKLRREVDATEWALNEAIKQGIDTSNAAKLFTEKIVDLTTPAERVTEKKTLIVYRAGDIKEGLLSFGTQQAAQKAAVGRKIKSYFIDIKNPATMIDSGRSHDVRPVALIEDIVAGNNPNLDKSLIPVITKIQKEEGNITAFNAIKQALENHGYDGIKYINKNEDPGSVSYMTLSQEQVRASLPVTHEEVLTEPETRTRIVSVETGEELEQADDLTRQRGESEEAYLARTKPVKSDIPAYNKEWDEQLINAVNQLDVSLRKIHKKKISKELGRKINVAQNFLTEREDVPAQIRYMASSAELKGNLKLEFEPLKLDQDHISYYYQKILIHPDTAANFFLGLHATEGLNAIFGMEKDRNGNATLPEPHQIKALEKYFGSRLAETLFKLREGKRGALSHFKEALNFPRAILAAFDMSFGGRQGLLLLPVAPVQWIKAVGQGYRAWTSPQYSSYIDLQIKSDPIYKVWKKMGGHFSELGSMTSGEEFWTSRLAHKIPGIPASERAYTTTANSLRFYTFKKYYLSWQGSGKPNPDYKLLAEFINHATGRGDIKGFEKYVPFLNMAFFAPRLQMGRIQSLGDLFRGSIKELKVGQLSMTRKLIAADLVAAFGGGMGVLFLLSLIKGVDVEKDPRSSDFGKIRFGNTRIDFWGGYAQMARLLAQVAVAETKGTDSKRIMSTERGDIVWRYIQTKLSPAAGMAVDVARGETFLGEKLEVSPEKVTEQIYERFTPLFMQDVLDTMRYQGMTSAAIVTPLAFHGIGAMTYPKKASAESMRIKDTVSKETFGIGWDDVGPVGQKLLMQNRPEIELAERKARLERENFDMVSKRIEEQQAVTKKMIKQLPAKVREEIKNTNTYIPGLSRYISNGWFLNDKRYSEYQKNVTIAMSLYLTKLMGLPAYKNAEPEMRALLIEEITEDIRKMVRDKITNEATIEDFIHIGEK